MNPPTVTRLMWFAVCLTVTACSTGTKVVTTTGKIVGKTAITAITTGGKVATTVVTTTGSVAGSLAKTAFVTVIDNATGTAQQIPWTEGMKLYTATKSGEVNVMLKAIQLLRGSQVIAATDTVKLSAHAPGPALQPGDVIRLVNLTPR